MIFFEVGNHTHHQVILLIHLLFYYFFHLKLQLKISNFSVKQLQILQNF